MRSQKPGMTSWNFQRCTRVQSKFRSIQTTLNACCISEQVDLRLTSGANPAGISRVPLSNMRALAAGFLLSAVNAFVPVLADDTEVFFGQADPSIDSRSNVLLVLDTSSSMNRTDGVHITRLERMKTALNSLIDNSTDVNIGLMRFNGSNGGGPVLFPVTNIDKEVCADDDCGQVTITSRVSNPMDDIVEDLTSQLVLTSSDTLSLGQNSSLLPQGVGLRFDELNIPQGARITQATIEFTASGGATSPASFTISAESTGNASAFTSDEGVLSGRAYLSAKSWLPDSWSMGSSHKTPDIADLLQSIVDQADWCGGNAIVLNLQGTGRREAMSSDYSLAEAPVLSLTYDSSGIPASGGCMNGSIVKSVSDDAEQNLNNNSMNLTSTDLELPYESKEQMIGIRFDQINIPKGSTITNSYVKYQIDEYKTGDVTLYIKGESTKSAIAFTSDMKNISDRTPTSAVALWINPPEASIGDTIQSPDLSEIIQEIIDRSDWEAGGDIAFLMGKHSGSGRRTVESLNGDATGAPKLYVNYSTPSGLGTPVATTITVRDKLKQVVADIKYASGTPIVDAYYEAAQYYLGGEVDYGLVRGYPTKAANRVSHPDSYTGGTVVRDALCSDTNLGSSDCKGEYISGSPNYVSPMSSSCQTSHVVLLSDGGASSNSSKSKVRSLIGESECEVDTGNETCGRSLATWLFNSDHSSAIQGKQNIPTYTIGFNLGGSSSAVRFLEDIAQRGGGSFHEAQSAAELTTVFDTIFSEVLSVDTSFVAPGATVNQFNRLTHRNDIYFAVFKPKETPTWEGNLKRYEVSATDGGKVRVMDVNGKPAVDETSGFFAEDSKSWWSDVTDGNAVVLGGAASEMVFDSAHATEVRRVFTFTGDSSAVPSVGVNLTQSEHALDKQNASISVDMLGLAGMSGTTAEIEEYRENLIDWARGIDVKDEDVDGDSTDWRAHMGDPMHSRPIILNYGGTADPHTSIFVATNEGFLHSIDRDEGNELYAVIPQELLPNLDKYMENSTTTKHPYGLDGPMSVWLNDVNNDVTINSGEDAFLYIGMRRGGSNYYALDVSDRINPKLQWIIKGGLGGTAGFEELGQSWSKMVPIKIFFEGSERQVLIFAGGYDTNQDSDLSASNFVRTADGIGRGIFIVDAKTGELIWSGLGVAGGSQTFGDMQYSIPSNIRVVDIDFDGLADQLYVGDMGGQLWRFDLSKYHVSGDLMTGGVIADLSDSGSANERRFFYEPDVALIGRDGERFLSISIGSGWRAHPLDRVVEDRFYMLRSSAIYNAPAGGHYGKSDPDIPGAYLPVTEADLLNVTDNIDPGSNAYGWFLDFASNGEKVLGDSITVNNQVIFTTFKPDVSVGDCTTAIGGGSVYVLDVLDGSPTTDLDDDGDKDKDDRNKDLTHGGIPPEPVALLTEDGPTILVGPEQPVDPNFSNLTQRTYWTDLGPDGESSIPADTD